MTRKEEQASVIKVQSMVGEDDRRPWKSRLESNYERLRRPARVTRFTLWPGVDGETEGL